MATFNISTLAQLQDMENHKTDTCVLLNDIDAAATRNWNEGNPDVYAGFDPIITFQGYFDGGGFTISNLYINRPTEAYVGLFGKTQVNADSYYIKDVTLENVDITGKDVVGALCGYVDEYDITNCHSSGTVEVKGGSVESDKGAGGLIGMKEDTKTISSCSSSCTVKAETDLSYVAPIGGLVGHIKGGAFSNCTASGLVTATMDAGNKLFYAGGFAGEINGGDFDECYATGDVTINVTTTSTAIYVGGFAGDSGGTIDKCFAYGDVTYLAASNANVGGFCGRDQSTTFDQCGAEGDVQNDSESATVNRTGGFMGYFVTADITNCYARGSVCADGIGHADAAIGGFIGEASTAAQVVDNCYSSGAVYATGTPTNGGGFCGKTDVDTVYTNCFYDNETSGWTTSNDDATGTTTVLMKTEATFTDAGWNFTTIWQLPTFTRSPGSGTTVWLSGVGDYEDFEEDVNDADSFSVTITSTNNILWIEALEALVAGTGGDEWKIGSNDLNQPITPTNFTVRQQTNYGSKQIQALKVNDSILFVDFVARKIREMTYSEQYEKYVAPDLTVLAEHITYSGITCIAHQKNPDSIFWCTLDDGSLISMTYDREQDVIAWADHPIGGTDAVVQSVCVIPAASEDEVWITVKRTINSADTIYVERMASRTFTDLDNAFFVDSGLTTTAPAASITLAHLIGETVAILADSVEMDTAVVGAGGTTAVKLNGVATNATIVQAGLQYTYKLQPMRPDVSGPGGTSHSSRVHVPEMGISFLNTMNARYGVSDSALKEIDFDNTAWTNNTEITDLFTGDVVVSVDGAFTLDNVLIISDNGPMPCTVRALVPKMDKVGR